jgi:hypothetical protein
MYSDDDDDVYGEGFFTRDEGRLPPPVRTLLEKVKDEKITSVQAWRYPLMKPLQDVLKKFIKLPYDDVFHLGINLSRKYNLEKDVVIKFTEAKERSDKPENKSKIIPVVKNITYGQLFDELRKRMGSNFTSYNARENNCQDFSLAILSVLGIYDNSIKTFIKQDAEKIYKSFGVFEKLAEAGANLNTLKDQVIDRLKYGEGHDNIPLHNNFLPLVEIQFK